MITMAHSTDVVAYTFQADIHCPSCIVAVLPTGDGEAFDGWALAQGVTMTVEANLDEIAAAFGIDRYNETSFDSGEFPKVVFRDQVIDGEHCGTCGNELES